MSDLLDWLQGSAFSQWIGDSPIAFPTIEFLHVLAVALLFGSIAVVDLRLIGVFSRNRAFTRVAAEMLRWTWVAFAVALATGLAMFIHRAPDYFDNIHFRLKMIALVFAGANMLLFELRTIRSVETWDTALPPPMQARIAGAISIIAWASVIVFGRWIGFSIQGFNSMGAGGGFDMGTLDPALFGL